MPRRTPRKDTVGGEPPDVMERRLKRQREYSREYRKRPAYKAYLKQYQKDWLARPGVAERREELRKIWVAANRESRNETSRKVRINRRAPSLLASIRQRAKKKHLAYDLDKYVEDIQQRITNGFCEVTGYPFDLTAAPIKGQRRFDAPSIDRIDPTKGYTYDNIRVVLNIVNYGMNVWGEDALRKVMSHWLMK